MTQPVGLPDFETPPLDELVLGVQFAPPPAYTTVEARSIWELFKADFPTVSDRPIQPPQFETFGDAYERPHLNIQLGAHLGSRLWFLSENEENLIQFQPDCFIVNWRNEHGKRTYPRYEKISAMFEDNLRKIANYFESVHDHRMHINQAQIGYFNKIPLGDFSEVSDWIKLWKLDETGIEAMNIQFTTVIANEEGNPVARLSHQIATHFLNQDKQKGLFMPLNYRGRPSGSDIDATMQFLNDGRKAIVSRFASITTTQSHKIWGKKDD